MTEPAGPPPDLDEPPAAPATRGHPDPLVLVTGGVVVGVVVAALHHAQTGMFVIAAALGVGGVLRLLLRPRDAGSLAVRSRQVDVLTLAALAVTVGVLAAVTPFPSGRG